MPTNPRTVHELITPLLLEHYKTPRYLLHESYDLQGISPLWPPVPGKGMKAVLFYFTPNSVCVFLFGTSEQRPSFGNNADKVIFYFLKFMWLCGIIVAAYGIFGCSTWA